MIDLIRTKTSLEKNGFFTYLFENRDEAVDYFLHFAGSGKSFGFAGSKTVEELGLYNILKERGNPCYWHWKGNWKVALKDAARSDFYVSSANAITSDGRLYFVDRIGNRISSICYGHEKVFIFAGRNKIVANGEEAISRADKIAIPLNSRRINNDILEGERSDNRVIDEDTKNLELFLNANPLGGNLYIFLINEDLGY